MVNDAAAWLVAAVKARAELAALGGRIFPDAAPEGAANPCLIYQLFGDEHEAALDPGMTRDASITWQIRIYADSRRQANALRDAFRSSFEGLEPVGIGGGWRIEGSGFGDLTDSYERETKDYGALGLLEVHLGKS